MRLTAERLLMRKTTILIYAFCVALLTGCAWSPTAAVTPEPTAAQTVSQVPVTEPPILPTPVPPTDPVPLLALPEGYALAFAEEFDEERIDQRVWNFELGPWPYNEELESYTSENAWLDSGSLVIEAKREQDDGRDYTSARLTTQYKMDFTYGYLEVRAALPYTRGTWPAIWLLPSEELYGGYQQCGEIDIMERVGHDAGQIYATIHTEKNNTDLGNQITDSAPIGEEDDDFHVYSMLWQESSIEIFLDGEPVLTYTRSADAKSDTWPFDVPFHIILNLAVGGTWGGETGVDDGALPQRMYVDYVRLYTLQ